MIKNWQANRVPLESCRRIIINRDGLIFILHEPYAQPPQLLCFNVNGELVWQREVGGTYFITCYSKDDPPREIRLHVGDRTLRAADDGTVWLSSSDGLQAFNSAGEEIETLPWPLETNEQLGSFVLLSDGFLALFHQDRYQGESNPTDLTPRCVFLRHDGTMKWQTKLPIETISHPRATHQGVSTGWKSEVMPPWRPRSWKADSYVRNPLLVCEDRILATFIEISSGLGISYLLDLVTGALLWQTEPQYLGWMAAADDGTFLVTHDGALRRIAKEGSISQEWAVNGVPVLTPERHIHLKTPVGGRRREFTAINGSGKAQMWELEHDYAFPYMAHSSDGRTVLWSNGKLLTFKDGTFTTRLEAPEYCSDFVQSHMLLHPSGALIFALSGYPQGATELWLVETDLAPLADSPWPCADGNLAGNPVYQRKSTVEE